jgi:hypothetical protein
MSGRRTDASALDQRADTVKVVGHLWRVGLKRGTGSIRVVFLRHVQPYYLVLSRLI